VTVTRPLDHFRATVRATAQELAVSLWVAPVAETPELKPPDKKASEGKPSAGQPAAGPTPAGQTAPITTQSQLRTFSFTKFPTTSIRCEALIKATSASLVKTLDGDACKYAVTDQTECTKSLKGTLNEALRSAKIDPANCTGPEAWEVVSRFLPAISDAPRVTATTTVANQPLQRFSFGLATGYLTSIGDFSQEPRAKIQNDKIAADPFSRAIAMGVVNLPLWGYDPSTFEPTVRERLRPFAGFAFAPYFGLTAGGSWAFTRTLAFTAGYARLWYDTPAEGETIGTAPVNNANPFRLASTNAWFVAAGFNFSK
jgi:hypothetical protein